MHEAKIIVQKFGIRGMLICTPSDVWKDFSNSLKVGDEVMVSVGGVKPIVMPFFAIKQETYTLGPIHGSD
jgi:hypothetical protein